MFNISQEKTLPRLSIIVAIYNVGAYVEQCIKSLIAQTYPELEIILVDDGSTDQSPEICDYYQQKDARIKVIHKQNEGLVKARKTGLLAASGEYIGYVDGDDWVEPDMYNVMMAEALQYDSDIIAAGHKEERLGEVVEIGQNTLPIGLYSGSKLKNDLYPFMLNNRSFSNFGIYSYLWNKVFKKTVLLPAQMKVDDRIFIAEDAACVYPALLSSKRVYVSESNLYHYRQRFDSMVKDRQKKLISIEKLQLVYDHLKASFLLAPERESLMQQLYLFIFSLLLVRDVPGHMKNGNHAGDLFPFGKIAPGSLLVINGFGTFGQHLYQRLVEMSEYKVVSIIDDFCHLMQEAEAPVQPLESIRYIQFDYVLIAFVSEKVALQKTTELIEMGVAPGKILNVSRAITGQPQAWLMDYGIVL